MPAPQLSFFALISFFAFSFFVLSVAASASVAPPTWYLSHYDDYDL